MLRRALLVVFASVLLLACSSDDKVETSSPTTTAATPEPTTEAPTTTAPALPPGAKKSDPESVVAVFARIQGLTSCPALQTEFDTASDNHDTQMDRGNTALAELSTRYMVAADKRMQKIDCY